GGSGGGGARRPRAVRLRTTLHAAHTCLTRSPEIGNRAGMESRATEITTGGRDENDSGARSSGSDPRADAACDGAVAGDHRGGTGSGGARRRAGHGRTWTGARPRRPGHGARAWRVAAPRRTTPHASWALDHLHGPAQPEGAGAVPAAGELAPADGHGRRAGG